MIIDTEEGRPRPLPPEVLANALQDRVHVDEGQVRAASSVKVGSGTPEPVAWVFLESWRRGLAHPNDCVFDTPIDGSTPLYTAPPAREWVGLTDDDTRTALAAAEHACAKDPSKTWSRQVICAAERMLKAKNT